MDKKIFAVDIGGSKLICAVLLQNGEILDTYRIDYPKNYTLDDIVGYIRDGFLKLKDYGCEYCGVAIPGLCDAEKGVWLYSPFSGIGNVAITQIISEMTGLPTFADNDVNISALAEKYYGVCRDVSDFIWITVSNGIGGGVFLNNKLYRGQNLSAGEIGHFIVEEENGRKCGCGNTGCLEAMASGASIGAIYCERSGKQGLGAKEVDALARTGDMEAQKVWQEAGWYIGKAASFAVNLLGIDTVVLGGGAAEGFDLLEESIHKALDRFVFKSANKKVNVVHSGPGRFAALMGCAALVCEEIKNNFGGK